LIVSKPRPKIIEKLYVHLEKYRDKILFRFTIGAMDDNILAFWEPNAPTYNDRKEALRYAFEKGFRTSISIEPMLDPEKVTYLVNDLAPFVNHSIWIGTMNTTWYMDTDPSVAKTDAGKERANNNLKYYGEEKAEQIRNEIFRIRTLQGAVTLRKIYENLKDNPLVQWKWHIKDALGLPLPTESEKWPEEPIEQVKELALEK
jgi:DNA repair photolyase